MFWQGLVVLDFLVIGTTSSTNKQSKFVETSVTSGTSIFKAIVTRPAKCNCLKVSCINHFVL